MRPLCLLAHLAATAALLSASLQAQVSSVPPRVTGPVNEQSLATLRGGVSPLARAEFDQGEAASSAKLRNVRLVLSRSAAQQDALDQFMAEQLDKSSPNYHRWLTPEEFGRLYGAADSDIAIIVAWLQSHGLQVEPVSSGRTSIAFSGTVNQMESAFHTPIHSFLRGGVQYFANTSDPRIPSALASVVAGVAQLNTYAPRPHLAKARPGMFDAQSRHFTPTDRRIARPELTLNNSFLFLTPADAATFYNTPNAYNAGFSSGTSYTGNGVTIGIGGVAAIDAATVVNYRTRFLNGDTTAPTITNIDNSAIKGNATNEAYIDNELAGGIAPGAAIHFYTADDNDGGLVAVIDKATADNSVDIFSVSFGLCEYFLTTFDNQLIDHLIAQMAVQGIAVTVSTGDSGSAGCDDPNNDFSAAMGLQVNGFASTPYNVAVGGTDTFGLLSNFSTYVNNNQSGADFYRSVMTYIPESTWNDSSQSNGLLSNNVPMLDSSSQTNIVAGSGGVSSCSVNTDSIDQNNNFVLGTCTKGYPKPGWQRGPGVPTGKARDLPDVSLMAGNGIDNATWLVCIDDTDSQSGFPDNCADQTDGNFYFAGFGGTSTAAPAFAGMLALVQESLGGHGHRLGADAAKTLYDLFNSTHAAEVFHDITQGNISVACDTGSPDCKQNNAGYDFLSGYDTGAGYDLATGIGSVNAANLVKYWAQATGTAKPTVAFTPTGVLTIADTLTIGVTVSGSAGTPIGTVDLSGGGYTSSPIALDANGKASFTIPDWTLPAGSTTFTVVYGGDANYVSATATTTVTIAKATPTVTVTPASSSVDASKSLDVTVKVTGGGPTPTGTVTLTGSSYTSAATTLSNGSAAIAIPANTFTATGAVTLTASYSSDSLYSTATGTGNVTINAPYSLTATKPSAVSAGSTATSTITVKSDGAYIGTVAVTCSLTQSPSMAQHPPACSVTAGSSLTFDATHTSQTATVTMSTTATMSASLERRGLPRWTGAGGAVLALLAFIGMPARRRGWRSLLGLLALVVALASFSACGSSRKIPGTTAGTYTFTVTGAGTPAITPAPTTTVTLTVN